MPLLRANGLDFMMETAGKGAPLLFLGGSGWDLRITRLPLDPPLSKQFQVALFDQRGQGRSARPPGPYTMADYAMDAVGLLDALGWNKAHVVGYSFGGMVAQELAIRCPDRVDRLVLAATSAGGAGGSSYPIHEFLRLPPEMRARRGIEVADRRFTRAYQAANWDASQARISARAAAQTRFMDEPGAAAGLEAQLAARAGHNTFDRLDQITAPTLLVAGRQDGQAPIDLSQAMLAKIPVCSLIIVEGAHDFLNENSEFIRATTDFCNA